LLISKISFVCAAANSLFHHILRVKLFEYVEQIRLELFYTAEQQSNRLERDKKPIDYLYSSPAKFIQQMETYKILQLAIKLGDIGIIQRSFARCCLLFTGSNKS
jgi:hypothetical protein